MVKKTKYPALDFDNYIRKGLIPKGHKRPGFKELSWNKYDLDKYLNEK